MSMDALTKITLETLLKEILPNLQNKLGDLDKLDIKSRESSEELKYVISESFELLSLIGKWAGVESFIHNEANNEEIKFDDDEEEISGGQELSKESAQKLMTQMEESDDEAMKKMLDQTDAHAQETPSADMSDDEAMKMLDQMDAPTQKTPSADMSDDEAMKMLDQMDAPPQEIPSADMSDEEAMKMLDQMDTPAQETPSADMSDDEAMKILDQMDEQQSQEELSPDDEALALLASMEADYPSDAQPTDSQVSQNTTPAPKATAQTEETLTLEEVGEIKEFGDSEFGSDPDMIKDFMENATELMEALDEHILELENNPKDKETIEEIFRAAHTLKGAAGMFGYQAIERVMHRMESFFDQVRKETLTATPDAIDVIFKGIDALKILMGGVETSTPTGLKTAPIVRDLTLLADGKYIKPSGEAVQAAVPADQPSNDSADDSKKTETKKTKKREESTIRVDLERLDALVNLVGELVTDRTRFMNIEEELRNLVPQLQTTANMSETVQLFGRHMNEIQDTIMKVRMVPIGNAFNKFTRVVRDISRQLGKEIDLYIEGETTELDKTLVEQIGDPLVHLIRNSCDHGVEMPEDRIASGKKPKGIINLSARQEGNHIYIIIQDDGKGIPVDIIRRKGIEKGLISEDDVLSDKEIFSLIFESGFSTAEQVTNISGRGVGMDVVRKQIQKLKGIIDVDSKLGKGTTITIQLPLTLAIVQSLLVQSKSDIFAIPLTAVVESIRISPNEIQKIGNSEVIKRRDQVLPLFHLSEVLDLDKKDDDFWYQLEKDPAAVAAQKRRLKRKEERLFVVVVGSAERRFGIVVDSLLNQQEMVIKSMGNIVKDIPCVAGGAILGNGEVVLVLDIADIDELFRNKSRTQIAA